MSSSSHAATRGKRFRGRLSPLLPHIILVAFSLLTVGPFVWTLSQAFHPDFENVWWTTRNFNQVIDYAPFSASYLNSIIVAGSVTACAVVTSFLVGFVLAKYRFRGREQLFGALIAAVMVPFSAVLIPTFVTVVHIGFNDSLGGLIVAGMWSPFGIFMVRQFLEGVPAQLLDAARIDGASEWRIVIQLMLPLGSSALSVLAVYTFMRTWDDFLLPALLLNGPKHWTLPVLLAGGMGASTPIVSAVVVLTTLPTLIIMAVTTKYFVRGIALISAQG